MRGREIGWGLCLAGLPFAPFFCHRLDLWHIQTLWMQAWVIGFFGVYVFEGKSAKCNLPLGLWVTYLLGTTLWTWTHLMMTQGIYPSTMLMGLMHLLVLLGFYLAATAAWTSALVNRLLRWMAWSGMICIIYSFFQWANLDPLFTNLDNKNTTLHVRDVVHGMTGNPTHYGAYLSLLIPVLLYRTGKGWVVAWGTALGLIVASHSATALVASVVVSLYCWWFRNRQVCLRIVVATVALMSVYVLTQHNALNAYGRFAAWKVFWALGLRHPWIGFGLGSIMDYSHLIKEGSPIYHWRHAHNEYLQIVVEQGRIGFILVTAMGIAVVRKGLRLPQPLQATLLGVLLAFALNSCLNFAAHLWVLGCMPLMAYCAIYAIAFD